MKNELENFGISDKERTKCEIWTRVMGYHRPISSPHACYPATTHLI